MSGLLFVLLSGLATAQDCDVKALTKETAEASPVAAARAYVQLGTCDSASAKKVAGTALPRLIAGDESNQAALVAIRVGAPEAVVQWMDSLQPDERARAISALGEACDTSAEVQTFFVDRAQKLGAQFWSDRWYRALASCHQPAVQGILSSELDKGLGADRSRFFAILETYSRSAGAAAVPRLEELAGKVDDGEAEVNIVAAFGDAARVGTPDGADAAAASASAEAIKRVASSLTSKGIEQARMTLLALGDEEGSDSLAAVRFADSALGDGTFLWGAIAQEKATCKNGKVSQRVHVAGVKERGNTWPDQLKGKVEAAAQVNWALDLAEKCKGTGETTWTLSELPFKDEAALKTWADAQVESMKDPEAKFIRLDPQALQI